MGNINIVNPEYTPEIMSTMSAFPFGFAVSKPDGTTEFVVVAAVGLIEAEQQIAEIYIDHDDYDISQESLVYILNKQYNGIATLSPTEIE